MSDDMQTVPNTPVSYLQQLQLSREPFSQDSTQDEFFLLDTERAQRLNMLYHMSQNSELLLVVTGIKGSGKTSLLHRFVEMRTDNWRQCVINANAMTNPEQLLIEVAEGFGLPQDTVNFGSGFEMLQKRLTEMKLGELMPILIIDDAHELPTASLTILLKLSELSDDNERLLRIVLFAEPGIMEMVNAPELQEVRHRITHTLTMPSLTEQQSIDYIQYRLSVAGLKGDAPFSQGQMKRIHRQANGIPGLINKFAQEMLLDSTTTQHRTNFSLAVRLRSLMSVFVILGIAGLVTWYLSQDVINSLSETQPDEARKLKTRELPLLPPATKIVEQHKDSNPDEAVVSAAAASNTDRVAATIDAVPPQPTTPITKPTVADKPNLTTAPLKQSKPVSSPVKIEQANNVPVPKSFVAEKTDIPKVAVSAAKPKPTVKTVIAEKPVKKPSPIAAKKDWLSQQNKNHYTLQIMGSRQRNSLSSVQRNHKIGSQSAIVRTKLKGQDWYILIYKSYPTKQQARNAANILPKSLRRTQPWPRRFGDIKSVK